MKEFVGAPGRDSVILSDLVTLVALLDGLRRKSPKALREVAASYSFIKQPQKRTWLPKWPETYSRAVVHAQGSVHGSRRRRGKHMPSSAVSTRVPSLPHITSGASLVTLPSWLMPAP